MASLPLILASALGILWQNLRLAAVWEAANQHWRIPLLIVCSAVVIKATVDGGPFSADSAVALGLYYALVRGRSLTDPALAAHAAKVISAIIVVLSSFAVFAMNDSIFFIAVKLIGASLTFANIGFWFYVLATRNFGYICTAIVMLYGLVPLMKFDLWYREHLYLSQPIRPDQNLVIRNSGRHNITAPIFAADGMIYLHRTSGLPYATLRDFYRTVSLPPGYFDVLIENEDCNKLGATLHEGEFTVIKGSRNSVPEGDSDFFESFSLEPCKGRSKCDFRYQAVLRPCLPENFRVLVINHLQKLGYSELVLRDR